MQEIYILDLANVRLARSLNPGNSSPFKATSYLDTKGFIKIGSLIESADTIEQILRYAEVCGKPINMFPFGEPQLGRRDLYPNVNSNTTRKSSNDSKSDERIFLNRILCLLNWADGERNLIEIAQKAGCSVDELVPVLEILEKEGLIKYNVKELRL